MINSSLIPRFLHAHLQERTLVNKYDLKRIDLAIMERLLLVLYESGKSKKTTIARNTKMSYDKCVKYLNCLVMLDFVKRHVDDGYEVFDLTTQGIYFCKRKLGIKLNSKYEENVAQQWLV